MIQKSSALFQKVFCNIISMEFRLIDGEEMVADGSCILANVSRNSWIDVEEEVARSMQSYLDCLDEGLSQQPGFKKPPVQTIVKNGPQVQQIQKADTFIMVLKEE